MKITFLLSIVVLFGFVGFGISSHYSDRKKFFFELKGFANALKNEISFSLTKLVDAVEKLNLQYKNKSLNQLLDNYLSILKNKQEISSGILFKNINILTEQEKNHIFLFFKRLGHVDIFNQLSEIDNYVDVFDEYYISSKKDSEKYCPLYTKMGVLIGLFVAIVFA